MSTFEKVRDIVVDQLGVEPDEVAIESTLLMTWVLIPWIS